MRPFAVPVLIFVLGLASWNVVRLSAQESPSVPLNLSSTTIPALSAVLLSWFFPLNGPQPVSFIVEAGSAPGRDDLAVVDTRSVQSSFQPDGVPTGIYYVRVRAVFPRASALLPTRSSSPSVSARSRPTRPRTLRRFRRTGSSASRGTSRRKECRPSSYVLDAGTAPDLSDLGTVVLPASSRGLRAPAPPAGTYYVRLRARNATGISRPATVMLIIPACLAPPTPVSFAVNTLGNAATFNWGLPTPTQVPPEFGFPNRYDLEVGSAPGLAELAIVTLNASFDVVPCLGSARHVMDTGPRREHPRGQRANGRPDGDADRDVCGAEPTVPEWTRWAPLAAVVVKWRPQPPERLPPATASTFGTARGLANVRTTTVPSGAPPEQATSLSGLPAGTYFGRVYARNPCGARLPSTELTFVVGSEDYTEVEAQLGPIPTFIVELGTSEGASNVGVTQGPFAGPHHNQNFSVTLPPRRYFSRVRARDPCGVGNPSNEFVCIPAS
jgi:hypothetical protein